MRYHELFEAKAFEKSEIPKEYKGLRVLGAGMTAVALEKDDQTVLIFTRDRMKKDWVEDQGIGKVVDTYTNPKAKITSLADHPIWIIEMPKLHKLSGPNVGLVRKAWNEYQKVCAEMRAKYADWDHATNQDRGWEAAIRATIDHFSAIENHILAPLWRFLMDYDPSQYGMDIGPRNFMQTSDGKLVILDPVADRELIRLVDVHNKRPWAV